jgi:hypothetical protein
MLAEIFMLRIEAIARANPPVPGASDTRLVPEKLPASPAKDQQQAAK